MEKLLRPYEAAEVLGVCRSKVYELIASGTIPSITIGKSRRIPLDALRERVRAQAEASASGSAVPVPYPAASASRRADRSQARSAARPRNQGTHVAEQTRFAAGIAACSAHARAGEGGSRGHPGPGPWAGAGQATR